MFHFPRHTHQLIQFISFVVIFVRLNYDVASSFTFSSRRLIKHDQIQNIIISPLIPPITVNPTHLFSSFIEDDDDEITYKTTKVPADMRYIPFNILRQIDNYKKIRNIGGVDTVNDVYVRDPSSSVFWFAGKIARCTGTVSLEDAIARQWHLIEQHAARLRLSRGNNELGPKFGELELWTAPGDSEMDVAYNRPSVVFQKMMKDDVPEGVNERVRQAEVGYEGELYTDDEEGFRTERDEEGRPLKEEIKGEVKEEGRDRRASDEEMDEMMKMLQAKKRPI